MTALNNHNFLKVMKLVFYTCSNRYRSLLNSSKIHCFKINLYNVIIIKYITYDYKLIIL